MEALTLYSEPFQPSGSIDARAAKRAIGRPNLDHWEVLLRETLQNSWDARLSDPGPIEFSVDGWRMMPTETRALKETVFRDRPRGIHLDKVLASGEVNVLLVTDKLTRGLAGPTRADLPTDDHRNFVGFVRNIGRDRQQGYGGGTYGFGKGVLYDASDCATVVVFSRTESDGRPVDRFIGMALGESFDAPDQRFTGRHWWGVDDAKTGVEPVTGRRAEALAHALGMGAIAPGESGTSIMVIAPVMNEGETMEEIVEQISAAATRWAWPHMLRRPAGPNIHFSFTCHRKPVPVIDPRTDPVLVHFAEAYERCEGTLSTESGDIDEWPWTVRQLRSERPARRLGGLAYRRYRFEAAHREGLFEDVARHVALMREPRFVVKYLPVPADPSGLATAGVFMADPALNNDFAESEPVAHDDWIPENLRLEKYQRNPVKQAINRLKDVLRQAARTLEGPAGGDRFAGLTSLSSYMGDLLEGLPEGTDARIPATAGGRQPLRSHNAPNGRPDPDGDNTPARERTHVVVGDKARLVAEDGRIIAEFTVEFAVQKRTKPLLLTATPRVVVDSGATENADDAPLGVEAPQVIGWVDPSGQVTTGESVTIDPGSSGSYTLRVLQPDDTAVTVTVTRERVVT
jgi:hypothetical protein